MQVLRARVRPFPLFAIFVAGIGFAFGNAPAPATQGGHWAFRPVERPELPTVKRADWPRDESDRFILARLEKEGLAPAPRAERRVLIRRLSFALTGLPPTPEDLRTHLDTAETDPTLAAYADALMDTEAFGEHWARHWLDHVRYRPFPGKSRANDPYRLWVVRAFVEDMPYHRFLKMQIAGDLMPSDKPDEKVNLDGLVAVRPFSLKNRLHQQLDLLGRTFMGLSLACAQCHDHKHEPLTRDDYYALRGLYESSRVVKLPYLADKAKFDQYLDGLARKEANEKRMKAELKEFSRVSQLMDLRRRIESERKKLDDPKEEKNHEKIRKNLEKLEKDEKKRLDEIKERDLALDDPKALEYDRLKEANKAFDETWKDVFLFDAFTDRDDPAQIKNSAPPKLGLKVKPGDDPERDPPVPRRFPVVLAGRNQTPLGERTKQSGRLQLAEWLASPEHPVTARLFVNRVWYYLFGEGLTPSVSNLGHSGRPPSHPALLDLLAHDFVKQGGSMKTLIRRLVLSATFAQASDAEVASRDERDRRLALFGLARVKRLEAESIWRTLNLLEHNPSSDQPRRPPPPDLAQELDDLFDGADSSLIQPRRFSSVSGLQALFFLNSEHLHKSAEKFALRLHERHPDDDARIRRAHLLLYAREASDDDLAAARAFLAEWTPEFPANHRPSYKNGPPPETLAKWSAYLRALYASNEFLYLD